jgi:hypothetical protein
MWPGSYWLKSSLSDDLLTDIVYGGGGGGGAAGGRGEGGGRGGGGRELCDMAGGELFGLPGLYYLKLK